MYGSLTLKCQLAINMFLSADAAQGNEKEKKVLLPAGVSKSVAYTVCCLWFTYSS
jgi:hypothetical protein